jgi:transposase-like protein
MIVCPECKSWDYYSHHYNGRNYYYCTQCGTAWHYSVTTSASTQYWGFFTKQSGTKSPKTKKK